METVDNTADVEVVEEDSVVIKKYIVNKEVKFHLHGAGKEKQTCNYRKFIDRKH